MTLHTGYTIGQSVPLDYPQPLFAEEFDQPKWYILQVKAQRENAAKEALKAKGVYSFFPVKRVKHFRKGKKFEREYPEFSRLLFAKLRNRPHWFALRYREIIMDVFRDESGVPIDVDRRVIKVLQGHESLLDRIEREKREAAMLKVNDKAIVISGPFTGQPITVTSVDDVNLRVRFETHFGHIKGEISVSMLEKVE